MKVALLFYGQPRFVDNKEVQDCYRDNILSKYETDVFAHTWWTSDKQDYDFSTWSKIKECPVLPNSIDIINEVYRPKFLSFQNPMKFAFSKHVQDFIDQRFPESHNFHWNKTNFSNVLSQLYSIKQVSNLFLNNAKVEEYDWVVLARFDTILINFPDLTKCDNSKFYLPDHHPRFPDHISAFGTKFLDWSKNSFDDVDKIYSQIWEPSPEAFKMKSFLSRFNHGDLCPYPMDAQCMRV